MYMGTPFPRVPARLHSWLRRLSLALESGHGFDSHGPWLGRCWTRCESSSSYEYCVHPVRLKRTRCATCTSCTTPTRLAVTSPNWRALASINLACWRPCRLTQTSSRRHIPTSGMTVTSSVTLISISRVSMMKTNSLWHLLQPSN